MAGSGGVITLGDGISGGGGVMGRQAVAWRAGGRQASHPASDQPSPQPSLSSLLLPFLGGGSLWGGSPNLPLYLTLFPQEEAVSYSQRIYIFGGINLHL